jgi:apolipoprotein N-acyltransferase
MDIVYGCLNFVSDIKTKAMKTQIQKVQNLQVSLKSIKPFWFLLAGILTMTASHFSFNIDMVGWIAMVPFLIYLTLTKGWKSRVLFALTLIVAWSVIVSKIITHPVPYFVIPLYAIPIALFHLPGYLLFAKFRNLKWSVLIFPATMVVSEWIQYTFTPFGSWGVAAYTQANSISLLQSLSLFGLAGLSFIIYWMNASIAKTLVNRKGHLSLMIPLTIIAFMLLFGSLRYDLSNSKGKETICMAAVGTDSEISGLPLPSKESNEEVIHAIFKRTSIAAESGAELVVWNEAAFFLDADYEKQWLDSISVLAKKNGVSIVAGYVVPISDSPFRYINKFQFFNPDGSVEFEYLKHQPVAGEPAVKGTGPQRIKKVAGSNIGGAICYDYDFPYLAKGNKDAGADIVAIPSSDWRGIDPLHSKMAAFRAIEQGHSILRSTRFGLSAAITPYGEMTSKMSSFDHNNKIMMAHLPAKSIRTVYTSVGDILVYLSIVYLLSIIAVVIVKKRK